MFGPLVSIVMPTYRRPHYLRQALASAVGQTYKNLQIIVRDNASGDDTPAVVQSFNDPRIEFYQALKTGSAWENGSECLTRVAGKYVLSLCDDDILGKNYVDVLVSHLEANGAILAAYGGTYIIDENSKVAGKRVPAGTYTAQATEIIRQWCDGSLPLESGINYVCPTSFILSLGESHCFPDGHNSDNAIFLAAGMQGKVLFTDACIFYYRKHSENSVQRHRCELRARGDKAFLAFLDAQVNSASNVALTKTDWSNLRSQLQAMLARIYYQHLLRIRLDHDSLWQLLCDTTVYPFRAYGRRNALALLRENKASLQLELRKRAANWSA